MPEKDMNANRLEVNEAAGRTQSREEKPTSGAAPNLKGRIGSALKSGARRNPNG